MNLDVLTRPFDASEIKQRDGRKGKRFDYVVGTNFLECWLS